MFLAVLSYVPVIIGAWLIGLVTLLKNVHAKTNIFFSAFTFFLGLWLAMLFIGDVSSNLTISLWAVRLATFFGTPMIASMIFFSAYFPTTLRQPGRLFTSINLAIPAVFMILALTPWLVPSVEIRNHSAQPTDLGLLYTLQSLYAVVGFTFGLILIVRKYRHVEQLAKAQIKLVASGLVAALLVNILTGFVLTILDTSNNYSNLVGSVSFLVFVSATSYAIVRHKMFDIRLAIVRTIGFLATVGLVGGVYSLLIIGVGIPTITDGRIALVRDRASLIFLIPPTLFIALTFHSIQLFIARVTRRIFYQDLFDLRQVLDLFSDTLVTSNDIDKIMDRSLKVISSAIKPTHAYFVVFDDSGRVYRKTSEGAKAPTSMSELVGDIKSISSNPVVREELSEHVPRSFMTDDIFLALRLGVKDRPVGVMLFGPKQNGRAYTSQDIDLLRIGAKNLAVALENAKKYDQITHFADTMHKEVLKATAELRTANDELMTLDTMKDDFISMASHQLRTPATSVHEALQMLNHPSMPLSKDERAKLSELAEASSEHMMTVVADMLSISRIQAGHFLMNKTPVVMQELIERVLKQTAVLAEQKHIKLKFDKPDELIRLQVDMAKINEVVSNYIENAVKYSNDQTTITVRLAQESKRVVFEVSDMGMGVPEKERKNLFGKFYRAANARQAQPDGNGIGLFVVKSIAEGHGGGVYYKPLSKGSLFGMWLPLEPPAKEQAHTSHT